MKTTVQLPRFTEVEATMALHAAFARLKQLGVSRPDIIQIWNNLNQQTARRMESGELWQEDDDATQTEIEPRSLSANELETLHLDSGMQLMQYEVTDDDIDLLRRSAAVFFSFMVQATGRLVPLDTDNSGAMSQLLNDC